MKENFSYQQLSVITYSILLLLMISVGIYSSADWILACMVISPVVLILFALILLRYEEEGEPKLGEGRDWYEHL
ncbi:MAG: hypothetical protein AAF806_15215 [Bacteroidota bacterium]